MLPYELCRLTEGASAAGLLSLGTILRSFELKHRQLHALVRTYVRGALGNGPIRLRSRGSS
jgi:hypothetical protein